MSNIEKPNFGAGEEWKEKARETHKQDQAQTKGGFTFKEITEGIEEAFEKEEKIEAGDVVKSVFADLLRIVEKGEFSPEEVKKLEGFMIDDNYEEIIEMLEEFSKNTNDKTTEVDALDLIDKIKGDKFQECVNILRNRK